MITDEPVWPLHVIRVLRETAQWDNKRAWRYAPAEMQMLVLEELDNDVYVRQCSWYVAIHEVQRQAITDDFRTYLLLLTEMAMSAEAVLTEKQYQLLLDLYAELPECFNLPQKYANAYWRRLYYKGKG